MIYHFIFSAIFPFGAFAQEKSEKQPQPFASTAESVCDFGAFVSEADPKGLNVREQPNANAKILGTIPPAVTPDSNSKFSIKPELKILGAKSGWFKIKDAKDNATLLESFSEIRVRKMYTGTGWVSGKKLTIKSQSDKGYSQPSKDGKVLNQKMEGEVFDDDESVAALKLIGCHGNWAYVEDVRMKKNNRYWLNKICGIQETSCSNLGNER